MDSDCEVIWASVQIAGAKKLYIGSYYRPPSNNSHPVTELRSSLSNIPGGPARDGIVLLGGDFNLGRVDWEEDKILPGCPFPTQAREMLGISTDHLLTQMNHAPTRGENCLDLIFTNHPQLVKSTHVTPGISDHDIVVLDTEFKAQHRKIKPRKVNLYNKGEMEGLKKYVANAADNFIRKNPGDKSLETI